MKWDECKGTQGEEKLYKLCLKAESQSEFQKRPSGTSACFVCFKVFSERGFKTIVRNQGNVE